MKKNKLLKYIGLSLIFMTVIFTQKVNAAGFLYSNELIKCGEAELPYGLPYIVGRVVNVIKIAIPILLIILGMIDYAKAVMASDEKQMSESNRRFIKRVIAAVVVFFVVAIVQFVFGEIVQGDEGDEALSCVACFLGDVDVCQRGRVTSTNNQIKNNNTSCDVTYDFVSAKGRDFMTITFKSPCGFEVDNTSCEYEDENGGNNVTGDCKAEKKTAHSFKIGANFTYFSSTFNFKFSTGETLDVKLSGDPYSTIERE